MFQHATLSGDALDFVETLLIDTPGAAPSDHRALSLYALLYQARGVVRVVCVCGVGGAVLSCL